MMKKIKAYKVVSFSGKIDKFQHAVNEWIISGWQPIGGMAVDCVAVLSVKYHQTMVLYEKTGSTEEQEDADTEALKMMTLIERNAKERRSMYDDDHESD